MKGKSINDARGELIFKEDGADIKAACLEAEKLGLRPWKDITELIRLDDYFYENKQDVIPYESTGRLSYTISFKKVEIASNQIGWSDEDFDGENIAAVDGRLYLKETDFLPYVDGGIALDLSNSPKFLGKEPKFSPIDKDEARNLVNLATNVVNLALQDPRSRSFDPHYGGYHAKDLEFTFDSNTRLLNPVFHGFEKCASNGYNGVGSVEKILSNCNGSTTVYLIKRGVPNFDSGSEKLAYAMSALFR